MVRRRKRMKLTDQEYSYVLGRLIDEADMRKFILEEEEPDPLIRQVEKNLFSLTILILEQELCRVLKYARVYEYGEKKDSRVIKRMRRDE